MSITGAATFLGSPSEGARCILNPGAALTSRITPPFSFRDCVRFGAIMSIPHMSRPMTLEIRSAIKTFSGCIKSVTSTDVPPVLKFAVDFRYKVSFSSRIDSNVYPAFSISLSVDLSIVISVSTFS